MSWKCMPIIVQDYLKIYFYGRYNRSETLVYYFAKLGLTLRYGFENTKINLLGQAWSAQNASGKSNKLSRGVKNCHSTYIFIEFSDILIKQFLEVIVAFH